MTRQFRLENRSKNCPHFWLKITLCCSLYFSDKKFGLEKVTVKPKVDGNNCSSFFSSSSSGHGQVVINMKCVRAIYEKALRLLQREQSLKHTAEKPKFIRKYFN